MISPKTAIALLLTAPATAMAVSPGDMLPALPLDAVAYIPASQRLDLIDYYEAGQREQGVRSRSGGLWVVDTLTAESITLRGELDDRITVQPLAGRGDTLIAVISTFALPQPDSWLDIYSLDGNRLEYTIPQTGRKQWRGEQYALTGDTLVVTYPDTTSISYLWNAKKHLFKKI